ncbi:MAG: hypothetical protein EBQ94_01625, partial [Flavobacteriales bacterium]|nr:hypothetical protein [Flavobacteriales bacterium]
LVWLLLQQLLHLKVLQLTYTRTSTGCSASTTITVNPIPVLTAPSSVCIGTPGALTPTTGGTWTSSNTNVATVTNAGVITGVAAGTVTFTFVQTGTLCSATTASVAINATPVISNMTTTVCSGTAFSVTPVNGTNGTVPTGTTYSWSAPTATGITGTASGTAASLISGTLTNTTSSTQTVAYTVTPTLGSCSGTPFTVTVTVNPRPTIAAKTATICSGGTFTVTPSNTLPDIVPTGTTYTWTVTLNGNVNGESAQATGQTNISQTLTGNASVQTVNYTVTPTSPSGTCAGSTFPLTVTVNPIPTFSATSANPASCGATNGSITLSGLTANTSYQLTYVLLGVTTGPTQRTSTGTGTIVISNLVAGSYTVSVALTSTGCQSTTQVVTLINPGAPDINDIADQVLCGGSYTLPTITGTNLPGNQAYYSSPGGVGPPLTGSISTSQTVYIYGISSGGCSDQESFTVTINTPASIAAKTATICSGGTFTVTPTNTLPDVVPTGTTYSWAAPSVTGVTGTAAGTAQSSISGTLVNSLNTPRTVVYSVTPTSGTCPGAAFNVTVTLNPVPAISDMTANACSTSAFTATPTNGTNGIVPSGTTYTWAAPTPAITGGSAQAVGQTSISQTLTNSTTTSTTATYTVTPTSGTCVGSTFQLVVTVNPRPIVTNRTATICSGGTFTVTPTTGGGNTIPTGTTYSWSAPSVVGISGTAAGTNQTSISG